jgi:hypothetical protein
MIIDVEINIITSSFSSTENHSKETFKPRAKERFGGHVPGTPDPKSLVA